MALHEIQVTSNAIDIAFNGDASLIAVLHQEGISVFEWMSRGASASGPALTGRYTFEKSYLSDGSYQQVSFLEKNEVLVFQRAKSGSVIKRYGFNDDTGRMEEMSSGDTALSVSYTLSSFNDGGLSTPFVQGLSGAIQNLAFQGQSLAHCKFPRPLPWVEIATHGADFIAFGMSDNGHLFANSRLLVKNCTSFLVAQAHLIFTTTTHLLKFIHITSVEGMPNLFPGMYLMLTSDRS